MEIEPCAERDLAGEPFLQAIDPDGDFAIICGAHTFRISLDALVQKSGYFARWYERRGRGAPGDPPCPRSYDVTGLSFVAAKFVLTAVTAPARPLPVLTEETGHEVLRTAQSWSIDGGILRHGEPHGFLEELGRPRPGRTPASRLVDMSSERIMKLMLMAIDAGVQGLLDATATALARRHTPIELYDMADAEALLPRGIADELPRVRAREQKKLDDLLGWHTVERGADGPCFLTGHYICKVCSTFQPHHDDGRCARCRSPDSMTAHRCSAVSRWARWHTISTQKGYRSVHTLGIADLSRTALEITREMEVYEGCWVKGDHLVCKHEPKRGHCRTAAAALMASDTSIAMPRPAKRRGVDRWPFCLPQDNDGDDEPGTVAAKPARCAWLKRLCRAWMAQDGPTYNAIAKALTMQYPMPVLRARIRSNGDFIHCAIEGHLLRLRAELEMDCYRLAMANTYQRQAAQAGRTWHTSDALDCTECTPSTRLCRYVGRLRQLGCDSAGSLGERDLLRVMTGLMASLRQRGDCARGGSGLFCEHEEGSVPAELEHGLTVMMERASGSTVPSSG